MSGCCLPLRRVAAGGELRVMLRTGTQGRYNKRGFPPNREFEGEGKGWKWRSPAFVRPMQKR